MRLLKDEIFDGVSLQIDDTELIRCKLINCMLEYSGGPVIFHDTVLQGCRYVFFGPAKATARFMQEVGLLGGSPADWGEENPQVN